MHRIRIDQVARLDGGADLPHVHLCRRARIEHWSSPDLSAPWWRLYLPLDPGAWIAWQGRRWRLEPGGCLLIAPGTAFAAGASAPFRKAYAHFAWEPEGRTARPGVHSRDVPDALRQDVAAADDGAGLAVRMLAVLGLACAALPATAFVDAARPGELVRQAQLLLAGDGVPPANRTVAAHLGVHPHSLVRRFAAELGCSPQAWAREQRLRRAADLLAGTSEGIDVIAERCGFWDRNHFTRRFTARWQCPPAAFRRRERPLEPA